jgi:hypothetical protein
MAAYLSEKIYVIEAGKPVLVIGRPYQASVKTHKAVKLGGYGRGVPVKVVITQHLPHLGLTRRIAYTGSPAAYEGYAVMPRIPEMPKGKERNHVAYVETLPGRVAAHIKRYRTFFHKGRKPFRVGTLGEKAPPFQIFKRLIHGL